MTNSPDQNVPLPIRLLGWALVASMCVLAISGMLWMAAWIWASMP